MSYILYIPILTTLFSVYFLQEIIKHYLIKRHAVYLLWWSIGVLTFGLGTFSESFNTLFGWNIVNFKFWYIVGALLGGFPLAQGTVYLLFKKKTADILSFIFVSLIIIAAVCVILSPVDYSLLDGSRLTGKVLAWQWVRMFSPFINIYSFIFLAGGASYSAFQYYKKTKSDKRFKGNVYIAIGSLLPGIGGTFTRFGHVEVLFVTELLGLVCIYIGYRISKQDPTISIHKTQSVSDASSK